MKKHCILFILLTTAIKIIAQPSPADSYLNFVNNYATIYNGEIERYYSSILYDNYPYYIGSDYTVGELQSLSNTYPGQQMRLDLYREQLILLTPETGHGVIVDPGHVKQFTLHGKTFIYLKPGNKEQLAAGYYQLVHKGEMITLLNKEKHLLNTPSNKATYHFTFSKRNYMIMDGKTHAIKSRRSLYKLFPQYKKLIKQHIKENNLNWKENPEYTLQQLSILCENLIPQGKGQ